MPLHTMVLDEGLVLGTQRYLDGVMGVEPPMGLGFLGSKETKELSLLAHNDPARRQLSRSWDRVSTKKHASPSIPELAQDRDEQMLP